MLLYVVFYFMIIYLVFLCYYWLSLLRWKLKNCYSSVLIYCGFSLENGRKNFLSVFFVFVELYKEYYFDEDENY